MRLASEANFLCFFFPKSQNNLEDKSQRQNTIVKVLGTPVQIIKDQSRLSLKIPYLYCLAQSATRQSKPMTTFLKRHLQCLELSATDQNYLKAKSKKRKQTVCLFWCLVKKSLLHFWRSFHPRRCSLHPRVRYILVAMVTSLLALVLVV